MSARIPESPPAITKMELNREAIAGATENSTQKGAPAKPVGPAWKKVVYRGQVMDGQGGIPVDGAVVSIFEGEDRLFTTLTNRDGTFELPADLYGIEMDGGDLSGPGWKPETYYQIRIDGGLDGKTERKLADIRADERLVFFLG